VRKGHRWSSAASSDLGRRNEEEERGREADKEKDGDGDCRRCENDKRRGQATDKVGGGDKINKKDK
jgi:hypothetical protein